MSPGIYRGKPFVGKSDIRALDCVLYAMMHAFEPTPIKEESRTREHFTEEQVTSWFVQLCMALQCIHSGRSRIET